MSTLKKSNQKRLSDDAIARLYVGDRGNRPVRYVAGNVAPKFVGESYHWTTMAGVRIEFPGAYNWPKIYIHSTLEIVVGREWIRRHRGMRRFATGRADDGCITGWYLPREVEVVGDKKIVHVVGWVRNAAVTLPVRASIPGAR